MGSNLLFCSFKEEKVYYTFKTYLKKEIVTWSFCQRPRARGFPCLPVLHVSYPSSFQMTNRGQTKKLPVSTIYISTFPTN